MKVIFLDFDGVLNSAASFLMESRSTLDERGYRVNESLCKICCSNFQYILDKVPDAKIVISSTWRILHSLDELKATLDRYGVNSSAVIGITPDVILSRHRGEEINKWLQENPEVTNYVILDDNEIGDGFEEKGVVVKTSWTTGLRIDQATEAIKILGEHVTVEFV